MTKSSKGGTSKGIQSVKESPGSKTKRLERELEELRSYPPLAVYAGMGPTPERPLSARSALAQVAAKAKRDDEKFKKLAIQIRTELNESRDPVRDQTIQYLNREGQGLSFLPPTARSGFIPTVNNPGAQVGSGIVVDTGISNLENIKFVVKNSNKPKNTKKDVKQAKQPSQSDKEASTRIVNTNIRPKVVRDLENIHLYNLKNSFKVLDKKAVRKIKFF